MLGHLQINWIPLFGSTLFSLLQNVISAPINPPQSESTINISIVGILSVAFLLLSVLFLVFCGAEHCFYNLHVFLKRPFGVSITEGYSSTCNSFLEEKTIDKNNSRIIFESLPTLSEFSEFTDDLKLDTIDESSHPTTNESIWQAHDWIDSPNADLAGNSIEIGADISSFIIPPVNESIQEPMINVTQTDKTEVEIQRDTGFITSTPPKNLNLLAVQNVEINIIQPTPSPTVKVNVIEPTPSPRPTPAEFGKPKRLRFKFGSEAEREEIERTRRTSTPIKSPSPTCPSPSIVPLELEDVFEEKNADGETSQISPIKSDVSGNSWNLSSSSSDNYMVYEDCQEKPDLNLTQ